MIQLLPRFVTTQRVRRRFASTGPSPSSGAGLAPSAPELPGVAAVRLWRRRRPARASMSTAGHRCADGSARVAGTACGLTLRGRRIVGLIRDRRVLRCSRAERVSVGTVRSGCATWGKVVTGVVRAGVTPRHDWSDHRPVSLRGVVVQYAQLAMHVQVRERQAMGGLGQLDRAPPVVVPGPGRSHSPPRVCGTARVGSFPITTHGDGASSSARDSARLLCAAPRRTRPPSHEGGESVTGSTSKNEAALVSGSVISGLTVGILPLLLAKLQPPPRNRPCSYVDFTPISRAKPEGCGAAYRN
jgi:hypothetical protein